ncbi:MlaD family protein [Patulibacter brassicae]|uniref:MlaD family protein n=1 Tax=Patulibacter brassicae TaxID=1705717 RepID=A0ABU4VPI9_9ACTN|nr:MlaD family protein [Patulibacter brassicae]MDX8153775.1 MlaD family protein [Patulibacter brassicae]
MQTKTPPWTALILPIGFVIACALITIAIWRSFGGDVPLEGRGYRVAVVVPEADSVFANTPVKTAGIDIGRVRKVDRAGRQARLELEIDGEHAPLRRGAKALVRSRSLLGEAYLELTPGPATAPLLPDGGTIPRRDVRRAQRLDDVLATFDPRTRAQFRRMIGGLDEAFAHRAQATNRALGHVAPLATNLDVVLRTLDGQDDRLTALVSDAASVFDAVGSRSAALVSTIRQTDAVLETTARRDRSLQATIAALPPFLTSLRSAAREVGEAGPELQRATASLRPTVPLLRPALQSLIGDTPVFQRVFGQLPGVSVASRPGVQSLERVLDVAGPSLRSIYDNAREVNPLMQLLALNRDSVVGAAANVASMTNGQHIVPGDKTRSYVSAGLTIWNEIVGGWVKKLPTNRQNPYPAPGSALNIAKGGLKAYDCRNVDNPAIFPAFGTGVPDCRTQQPWTFQGRTAAYPRLYRAAP